MQILILTHAEVEKLLPMDECVLVMENVLALLAKVLTNGPIQMNKLRIDSSKTAVTRLHDQYGNVFERRVQRGN